MDSLKSKTLLLVDDDPDIRDIIRCELEGHGAQIIEAGDGDEALGLMDAHRIDAVLTDILMPNKSGMELLKKIRLMNPSVPIVIVITGQAAFSQAQAIASGASAVFAKPTNLDLLVATLKRLLGDCSSL